MKKRIFLLFVLIVASAFLPMAVYAQTCDNISGLINGNNTITLTDNCVINEPVTITGNVTIKSSVNNPHTLTRNVSGNLITIAEGAALTLENIIIDGNKQGSFSNTNTTTDSNTSLIFIENGAALIMNNGVTLQNNISSNGGAVSVGNGSKFTMNGGEISGNTSNIGGGVFMRHGGIFTMTGGAIINNTAQDFGGGVFVNDACNFTMTGGNINNNTASGVGGGVNVWGGEFTMTGGAICDNTAADGNSVFVYDGAVFNNESGSICDSTANNESLAADQDSPSDIIIKNNNKVNTAAPINLLTSNLSAGPNPVSRTSNNVTFFHQGNQIRSSKLKIYDASGKFINNLRISDKTLFTGNNAKRAVGSWNLKDSRGRLVSEGTYIVKGNITLKDGKRENISLVLGVR